MSEPPRKIPSLQEELPIPVEVLFDEFLMMQFLWDYIASNQCQWVSDQPPRMFNKVVVYRKSFINYILSILTQLNNNLNYLFYV